MEYTFFRVKAVFMDLDGVLYDSMAQYEKAWIAGFAEIGCALPSEEVYLQEGRSAQSTVAEVIRKYLRREATQEEILSVLTRKAKVLNALPNPPVQSGARTLLQRIGMDHVPIFVVTGSTKQGIRAQITKDFPEVAHTDRVITGDDVRRGKPDPEPYLLACRKAGRLPSEVIVIENGPLGIKSAVDAGCLCIGVNTGPLSDEILLDAGAFVVFPSCTELARKWDAHSFLREPPPG